MVWGARSRSGGSIEPTECASIFYRRSPGVKQLYMYQRRPHCGSQGRDGRGQSEDTGVNPEHYYVLVFALTEAEAARSESEPKIWRRRGVVLRREG